MVAKSHSNMGWTLYQCTEQIYCHNFSNQDLRETITFEAISDATASR